MKIRGSGEGESLFGSDRSDIIIGNGPLFKGGSWYEFDTGIRKWANVFTYSSIQANSGNDLISGGRTIDAGTGNDRYFDVYGPGPGQLSLGAGSDFSWYHGKRDGDGWWGGSDIDAGGGNDRIYMGSGSSAQIDAGTGRDTVIIQDVGWDTPSHSNIDLGYDNQRDVVRINGDFVGGVGIHDFGKKDVIEIYGSGLSESSLHLRTSGGNNSYTGLTITLPNESTIGVDLQLLYHQYDQTTGSLADEVNIRLHDNTFKNYGEVLIGNSSKLQRAFFGTAEDEIKTASSKTRALLMGSGDDTAKGSKFADKLYGDAGDDKLTGRDGKDSLFGMDGNDSLWGGDGNDTLQGFDGNDRLSGNDGNDVFEYFGDGDDTIYGGDGNDRFIFSGGASEVSFGGVSDLDEKIISGGNGADIYRIDGGRFSPFDLTITDFNPSVDRIDYRNVPEYNLPFTFNSDLSWDTSWDIHWEEIDGGVRETSADVTFIGLTKADITHDMFLL